jgi:GNAT superfamily N-acetyltransferase
MNCCAIAIAIQPRMPGGDRKRRTGRPTLMTIRPPVIARRKTGKRLGEVRRAMAKATMACYNEKIRTPITPMHVSHQKQPQTSSPAWTLTRVAHPPSASATSLWEVTEIQAHVDGTSVGFLRISHIPRARYETLRPTALDKIATAIHENELLHLGEADLPSLKRALHVGHLIVDNWATAVVVSDLPSTPAQARRAIEAMTERLNTHESTQVKRREFEAFHLDRPMVDKIEVTPAYQRQGMGRALYLEAARWVAEQGLQLHASQIQTVAAKAVWTGLARDGLAQMDDTGPVARFRIVSPPPATPPALTSRAARPRMG